MDPFGKIARAIPDKVERALGLSRPLRVPDRKEATANFRLPMTQREYLVSRGYSPEDARRITQSSPWSNWGAKRSASHLTNIPASDVARFYRKGSNPAEDVGRARQLAYLEYVKKNGYPKDRVVPFSLLKALKPAPARKVNPWEDGNDGAMYKGWRFGDLLGTDVLSRRDSNAVKRFAVQNLLLPPGAKTSLWVLRRAFEELHQERPGGDENPGIERFF